MTQIVYFSGVHGTGKSTLIKELEERLIKSNLRVKTFPEFLEFPKAKIGTMEFQMDYKAQMLKRENEIEYAYRGNGGNNYEFIFCDRAMYDVDIYTANILGITDKKKFQQKFMSKEISMNIFKKHNYTYKRDFLYRANAKYYLIDRDVFKILKALEHRNKNQMYRRKWNEEKREYVIKIKDLFLNFFPFTKIIDNNHSVDNSIVQILADLY